MVRTKDPTPLTITTESGLWSEAHKHSYKHRIEIEASARCGCFSCFKFFPTASIKSWIDGNQTALCPLCGVDTILGSASRFTLDETFLRRMHTHLFAPGSKRR